MVHRSWPPAPLVGKEKTGHGTTRHRRLILDPVDLVPDTASQDDHTVGDWKDEFGTGGASEQQFGQIVLVNHVPVFSGVRLGDDRVRAVGAHRMRGLGRAELSLEDAA